jgi:AcrR family transcriptional regulator
VAARKSSVRGEEDGRWARKHRAILDAATAIFLREGYLGTSMDEIAARARVSKQTVYTHFADKERLFTEIVAATVDEASDPVYAEARQLRDSGDLEVDLGDLARRQLRLVMQPRLLALRRLVIAEATRFPQLGRTFYERGAGRTVAALAETFAGLAARDLLDVDDPLLAATHFNWLVMSAPVNQAMLLGRADPDPAELDRFAEGGVRAFLAAYGRRPAPVSWTPSSRGGTARRARTS